MTTLARKLGLSHYFSLAWGTMVGVGWLVVMDDWLKRGGPAGGLIAFAIGGVALLPVAYVYGQLIKLMPDAAGEVAYVERAFSPGLSYPTGWIMLLTYLIVCPWEAIAIGRISGYLVPALNSIELYRVGGSPVYLPHLVIGLAFTAVFTAMNYRGIQLSATFQNWATAVVLALIAGVILLGVPHGSAANFVPAFNGSPFVSVLLMLQVVPYFMTGFESISKSSEEATAEFDAAGFGRAMVLAIGVGTVFYLLVIASVSYLAPWQSLLGERFATAAAFEHAVGHRWVVNVIMGAALVSLLKIMNGTFVASSRLIFALGRRGLVNERVGRIHPVNRTPSTAILWTGAATAAGVFLGGAILVPVTEVAAVTVALGWLSACASYLRLGPSSRGRAMAIAGVGVTGIMVLMKVLPFVPGHFSRYEWLALAIWCLIGWAVKNRVRAG